MQAKLHPHWARLCACGAYGSSARLSAIRRARDVPRNVFTLGAPMRLRRIRLAHVHAHPLQPGVCPQGIAGLAARIGSADSDAPERFTPNTPSTAQYLPRQCCAISASRYLSSHPKNRAIRSPPDHGMMHTPAAPSQRHLPQAQAI